MKRMRRVTCSASVLLLAMLLPAAGCGRKAADARTATPPETLLAERSPRPANPAPNEPVIPTIEETTAWPAGMPADVPEFTSGKVERVSKTTEGAATKFTVYLHEIEQGGVDRYADVLRQGGWKVERMDLGAQGAMLNGQKAALGITLTWNDERRDGMLAVFPATP